MPRGYIEPTIEEISPGKYKISVFGAYEKANTFLNLSLQGVVNDGKGNLFLVKLKELQGWEKVNPKPRSGKQKYASRHEFTVTAKEIDQVLSKAFPNSPKLRFHPGGQFFVHGGFKSDPNSTSQHNWGGTDRGGGVALPGDPPKSQLAPSLRPTALDITYPQKVLASTTIGKGLDPNGNVGSRVEMEGKWAPKGRAEFEMAQDRLLALVKNPDMKDPKTKKRILPVGWTIKLEDRYVLKKKSLVSKKNPNGYVLDKRGVPVADPMVDIASDSKNLDLAKTDSVLRARTTNQNKTTVINYKSGGAGYVTDKDGIVYRPEFQAAVKGGDPKAANAFWESDHPLNFMKGALKAIGIAKPADVTAKKTVEQRANRLKFKLEGPNNLEIEVSTDHVMAKSLLNKKKPAVEYFQIEADAAHLAVRTGGSGTTGSSASVGALDEAIDLTKIDSSIVGKQIRDKLNAGGKVSHGSASFFDGRPVLHTIEDLDPKSPMMKANAADFAEFKKAMVAIRDYALDDWAPAANKLAMSNFLLGHYSEAEASPSVKAQLETFRKKGWLATGTAPSAYFKCPGGFAKLGK